MAEIKRLADFPDIEGARVIARLLPPLMDIVAASGGIGRENPVEYLSTVIEKVPDAFLAIFAALSGVQREDYHTNAAEIIRNVMLLAQDADFLELFSAQSQMQT